MILRRFWFLSTLVTLLPLTLANAHGYGYESVAKRQPAWPYQGVPGDLNSANPYAMTWRPVPSHLKETRNGFLGNRQARHYRFRPWKQKYDRYRFSPSGYAANQVSRYRWRPLSPQQVGDRWRAPGFQPPTTESFFSYDAAPPSTSRSLSKSHRMPLQSRDTGYAKRYRAPAYGSMKPGYRFGARYRPAATRTPTTHYVFRPLSPRKRNTESGPAVAGVPQPRDTSHHVQIAKHEPHHQLGNKSAASLTPVKPIRANTRYQPRFKTTSLTYPGRYGQLVNQPRNLAPSYGFRYVYPVRGDLTFRQDAGRYPYLQYRYPWATAPLPMTTFRPPNPTFNGISPAQYWSRWDWLQTIRSDSDQNSQQNAYDGLPDTEGAWYSYDDSKHWPMISQFRQTANPTTEFPNARY